MKLRVEAIGLGLVFCGPLLLAAAIYYGPFDRAALPRVANPERVMLEPGRTLDTLPLQSVHGESLPAPWTEHRWALIYVRPTPCGAGCIEQLDSLARIHAALGRDSERMRRVALLTPEATAELADAGLARGRLDPSLAEHLGVAATLEARVFVADPLGNLVLVYPADPDRKAMLADLERLLDASRIG